MMRLSQLLSKRLMMTVALFLIGTLHTMLFTIFQIPENFLMGEKSVAFGVFCKIVLYLFAILACLFHQSFCHLFGLRKTLYLGLLCNLLGFSLFVFNQAIPDTPGKVFLILFDMAVFGVAISSVINALVTYIVIEYPKNVGLAIVALFAFFNLGAMLAPILINLFPLGGLRNLMDFYLIALLVISIWFVHSFFFDPPISTEKIQMKKGSLIWKELHYRLALFVVAIASYGIAETIFNLWGYIKIKNLLGIQMANEADPIFWMFTIIGQIFLLIPLYLFSQKHIFYLLIAIVITAAYHLPEQNTLQGHILWLAIAGFGCSAVFPLLLSQMEKEMMPFATGKRMLPYIEKSISLMVAGYFTGIGIVDIWIELFGNHPYLTDLSHFHIAAYCIAVTGLIDFFLNYTAPKIKS